MTVGASVMMQRRQRAGRIPPLIIASYILSRPVGHDGAENNAMPSQVPAAKAGKNSNWSSINEPQNARHCHPAGDSRRLDEVLERCGGSFSLVSSC